MQKTLFVALTVLMTGRAAQIGRAAEPTWNYAVQASAAVQTSPAKITLSWPQDTVAVPNSYTVYRKSPSGTAWGSGTVLSGSITTYADTNVTVGTVYEYQIVKAASTYTGYGYVYAGINAPLTETRGKLVLIVDSTYAANLAPELNRLQQDLTGDGWTVLRHDVARNASVPTVKNLIKADYTADPANVKALLLFGHVPVPYSGLLNPDGHADHYGAWPADVYYGDMDGTWTDSSVNYVQSVNTDPADAARLSNVPGDGKFDPTAIPSAVELQVGRVDLANLPGRTTWGGPATFPSEQELLRQYLNKDHNYRHKLLSVPRRGLVGDYFGVRGGEAFAASAFRNFAPFFGAANIDNLNLLYNDTKGVWIPTLRTNSYLWAYGCGAGSYSTIGGLGNTGLYNDGSTVEMVNNDVRAVFVLLFGSWLGDWDHEDNIMRSVLATPSCGLVSAWSGRPHWFAQPMGLGETIGYTARLTQNNSSGLYNNQINSSAGRIHVALMGDPTLRLHPVAPPSSLAGVVSTGVSLSWLPSTDSVLGYHVYRAATPAGPFTRLSGSLLTGTTYLDTTAPAGTNTYMVRAVKLETASSGSYYNASQGAFWTVGGTPIPLGDTTPPTVAISTPANNASVSGTTVAVSATASDNVGVVGVQFQLDGANLGAEVLNTPYSIAWNSTTNANGPHTLSAIARDLSGNRATATINVSVTNAAASTVVWIEDALPAGAGPGAGGGDAWTWTSGNPTPYSGTLAHQSSLSAGLHEHYFNWATATLPVNSGDVLFTYVYLDPVNPPTEIMLSWNADNWEHRAYWGANNITYGADGTAGRRYLGPLPAAGQWVRLEVPASQVGLEGQTLTGMGFSLFDGRATWDYTGKSSQTAPPPPLPVVTVVASDATATIGTADNASFTFTRTGSTSGNLTVNYALGGTAVPLTDYRQPSGDMPTLIIIPSGAASATAIIVAVTNSTHVSPQTVVLSLSANAAYTIASPSNATVNIVAPQDTTPPAVTMTAPANNATVSGSVVAVSASASDNVGVVGVQFQLDGANLGSEIASAPYSLNWNTTVSTNGSHRLTAIAHDLAGNRTTSSAITVLVSNVVVAATDVVWIEDALPVGAGPGAGGGDAWTWISSNPTPYAGSLAHQSSLSAGLHEHYFNWATATLPVVVGETLFTYVYLDAANPPAEIMLSWNDGSSWEHRAYWGANNIAYGTDGTAGRRYMGSLPAAGQWVRLDVPASAVALEGVTVQGMGFSLFNGRATWDHTGKSSQTTPPPALPMVMVVASDNTATIGTADTGTFTFTRSGSTSADLTLNYTLGGTAIKWTDYRRPEGDMPLAITIPAGAASANLVLLAFTNSTQANPLTVSLALASDASYTLGSPNNASITLVDSGSVTNLQTSTNGAPTLNSVNYTALTLPKVNDTGLNILSPTLLELHLINTKQPDPARVTQWDFVDANYQFQAPALSEFAVTVAGQPVTVQAVGFKRRPLYAPNAQRDLRIDNCLYLRLASPIADNQSVEVRNPSARLWSTNQLFQASAHPLRESPVIHVNQEGYVPGFAKQAMVGYYLGSLGEMDIPAATPFKLVDASTGAQVYQGTLTARPDIGYTYTPTPYQKVLAANFSDFATPGEYLLVVPGYGASLPFLINDGVAMAFTRAYALGLFHQRCGANLAMPYTRFTHNACHTARASVPVPQSSFTFTWNTIATYSGIINADNPTQIAPRLQSESSQLYPFVNTGTIDVSGGHHDAGDYSKYTINCASLIHHLMFAVDSLPGVAALDNLGLPESGDGISDLMQEAKWEADYVAKLQDADGGFYFLVYPQNREYEGNVLPEDGDPQVVWPKTTAVTAAAVAALAQCASSPRFKAQYPAAATAYMQKAQLGWTFLTNAIARYGKDGAYQKITHYGDNFTHNDELAWAACEMFLATGNPVYQQTLLSWFDPADPATLRWGWWRMAESYGNAMRSFAFAARSGRLAASQLDATFLGKCQTQIAAAGDDAVAWSQANAYGSSFPDATKRVKGAGWFFSADQAYDMTVAYQLNPRPEYLNALVANMNYEGGCNPVNVTYVTGLGWKRQREIVHQYAQNDRRVLPPTGIPLGNIQAGFVYLYYYGSELASLCYPQDSAATAPYPFYDRWGDSYNVTTEFVVLNQARGLANLAFLATLTSTKTQAWTSATAQIVVPANVVAVNTPVTLSLAPGLDLRGARIVWDGRDQEPAFGATYAFVPKNNGAQWVEAEIQWPDGRRVFAVNSFSADSPVVTWVDDTLPAGAIPSADGGDAWTWVAANPAPFSGTLAHQSALAAGMHEHYFDNATATLQVNSGDTLFAYVYLDAANPPTEVMLMWNNGNWEHRAYWGANQITYGADATAGRRYMGALPASGQWVRLEVPASTVALEGSIVKGMAFSLYGGRATWDVAGKSSSLVAPPPSDTTPPTVALTAPLASAIVAGSNVVVAATASDNVGVAGVQFKLDGVNLGSELAVAPYAVLWNSVTASDGLHQLSAVARDAAGNRTTSASVTVLVSNLVVIVTNTIPTVTVAATDASASRVNLDPGQFIITRNGSTAAALTVNYTVSGTATNGVDYNPIANSLTIPAGAASATVTITPKSATVPVGSQTVVLTLAANAAYTFGISNQATVAIVGNAVPITSIKNTGRGMVVTWSSAAGKIYRVAYKNSLTDTVWTDASGSITATGTSTSWTDATATKTTQRYYLVYVTN